jgi:hypothetical protein
MTKPEDAPTAAVGSPFERPVGRLVPERAFKREPMPVRCEICQWRGRRLTPRSAPCPACGSRVEFA